MKKRRWTPEEDEAVRKAAWAGRGWAGLAKRLDRTLNAVILRAVALRRRGEALPLHRLRIRPGRWTPEEETRLRALVAAGEPLTAIAKAMRRSLSSVDCKADHLGLKRQRFRRWNAREKRRLMTLLAQGFTTAQVGRILDRSESAVRREARKAHPEPKRRSFSSAEDETITARFSEGVKIHAIADEIGRAWTTVAKRIDRLGLERAPKETRPWTTKEIARMLELRAAGVSCRAVARELDRTANAVAIACAKAKARPSPRDQGRASGQS